MTLTGPHHDVMKMRASKPSRVWKQARVALPGHPSFARAVSQDRRVAAKSGRRRPNGEGRSVLRPVPAGGLQVRERERFFRGGRPLA